MSDLAVARAVHVVAVVLWIGGVGMVTMVLMPSIRRARPIGDWFPLFHMIEARFAPLARWMIAIAGVSGVYMLWRLDAWGWFQWPSFWWLHAMVLIWLLFTLMLFVIEPLLLHRFLARQAALAPEATYRRMEWLHRVLLVLSLITVAGAVVGMG